MIILKQEKWWWVKTAKHQTPMIFQKVWGKQPRPMICSIFSCRYDSQKIPLSELEAATFESFGASSPAVVSQYVRGPQFFSARFPCPLLKMERFAAEVITRPLKHGNMGNRKFSNSMEWYGNGQRFQFDPVKTPAVKPCIVYIIVLLCSVGSKQD